MLIQRMRFIAFRRFFGAISPAFQIIYSVFKKFLRSELFQSVHALLGYHCVGSQMRAIAPQSLYTIQSVDRPTIEERIFC